MSVNLNITVQISLDTIDQIRKGKKFWDLPEAPEVQADATRAVIDAAINFPYEIDPPVPEPREDGTFDIWIDLAPSGRYRLCRVKGDQRMSDIARELYSSGDCPDMEFRLVYRGHMIYNGFLGDDMDPSNTRTLSSLEIGQDAIIKHLLTWGRS